MIKVVKYVKAGVRDFTYLMKGHTWKNAIEVLEDPGSQSFSVYFNNLNSKYLMNVISKELGLKVQYESDTGNTLAKINPASETVSLKSLNPNLHRANVRGGPNEMKEFIKLSRYSGLYVIEEAVDAEMTEGGYFKVVHLVR